MITALALGYRPEHGRSELLRVALSTKDFGYLPLFALMFLFRPVIDLLLTPARHGMVLLLRLILPFSLGDRWNIFS